VIAIERDTPLPITIYSTLTRTKAPFETIEPGRVSMYVCGNTVYDNAHIGHAMSSVVFDVIRRYLEFAGYRVILAKNYTDVDDKIINRANAEGLDPAALVESLIAADAAESQALNVIEPTLRPRATEEIPSIIRMVEGLIANGHAYERNGDVYFRVRSFDDYGKLSQRNVDDMRSGYRIGVDEDKEDPLDFALWKSTKPGEPSWPSPWSDGRPGWHIECSAMCSHHLGEQVDIHGGGTDLVFPHHENEIAQSEAFFGKGPFARYWLHNGMLTIDGQKMSKSIGNVVTIQSLIDRNRTAAFRLMILQSHYRVPFTYSDIILQAAQNALDRLRAASNTASASDGTAEAVAELDDLTPSVERRFIAAMSDDFDTPGATAAIFDLARAINRVGAGHPNTRSLIAAGEMLRHLTGILGLRVDEQPKQPSSDIGPYVELLIDIRNDLRAAKQFALADKIRNELTAQGVTLEDSPTGTTWKHTLG
jgi:cysteinyl-tRNA synthetase